MAIPDSLATILPFQTGLNTPFSISDLPVALNSIQIALVDILMREAVNGYNAALPTKKRRAFGIDLSGTEYRRQYISGVNPAGDTLVWVNAFCDHHLPENWKIELVLVKDGGNCYFSLTVNLTKRRVTDIIVNGQG